MRRYWLLAGILALLAACREKVRKVGWGWGGRR